MKNFEYRGNAREIFAMRKAEVRTRIFEKIGLNLAEKSKLKFQRLFCRTLSKSQQISFKGKAKYEKLRIY